MLLAVQGGGKPGLPGLPGLPSIGKPDLGGLFAGLKPFGGGGKPKPSYNGGGGGIGLEFTKPQLPQLDLSGLKNVFSGIVGFKQVECSAVWPLC